jgi:virulence-associated protein VapD
MFAIAFDLVVAHTAERHLKGVSQAYADIGQCLSKFGFTRVQGSLYISDSDSLAQVFQALDALKKLDWFAECVRDIRAFKVEHWSDFTQIIKST